MTPGSLPSHKIIPNFLFVFQNCYSVHSSDWADAFSERAGDSSDWADNLSKSACDNESGVSSRACKIISKVCSPMGCVCVPKIFNMGATCDEL